MSFFSKFLSWVQWFFNYLPPLPPDAVPKPEPIPEPAPEPVPAPVPPAEGDDDQPPDSGFIWKPVADVGGMLAIILPYQYDCRICLVVYDGGEEAGNYIGRGNGHRQAFRYSHPGRYYGRNVRVVASMRDGSTREWRIPAGAKRTEYR